MEKKIEEMAQDIAQVIDDVHAGCRLTDCEDCRYFKYDLEDCKSYAIAERLEALDYRKQVQGEWIEEGCNNQCSVCGYESIYWIECKNYCANCGAKMKGAE